MPVDPVTVGPLSLSVEPAGAPRGGGHAAESRTGFADALAQASAGIEETPADTRPHLRRGLPERADVRDRLERLARHWAVVNLSTPPPGEMGGAGAAADGSLASPLESAGLVRASKTSDEPNDAEASQLLLAMMATGTVTRELRLPPQFVAVERSPNQTGSSERTAGVTTPDDVQGLAVAARFVPVAGVGWVPPEADHGSVTSETSANDPERSITELETLVGHPQNGRAKLGIGGPLRRGEPPSSTPSPASVREPSELAVEERETASKVAAQVAVGVARDGDWIRLARQQLRDAIDVSRPGGTERAEVAQGPTSAGDPAVESQAVGDARRVEPLQTADVSQSATSSRGDASLGRRRVVRATVRDVMFESVRRAARSVGSQMAAFGPATDPGSVGRSPDGRARSMATLAAPVGQTVGVGATSLAAPMALDATPRIEPVDESALASQIVQAIRVHWGANGGDVRLRLHPEYLGELTISLKVDQGMVTAHLESSLPDVKRWIESHEGVLRQGLANHDLRLDRLVVTTTATEVAAEHDGSGASADRHARRDSESRPRDESPRRRPETDAEAPPFEVIV